MEKNKINIGVATKNGGLILSSDDGRQTWNKTDFFLKGEDVNKIISDGQGKYYAASLTEGVFSSSDGGKTWKPSSRGLNVRKVWSLAVNPRNKEELYAGTQYGHLFRSLNSGGSWEEVIGLHDAPGRKEWGVDWVNGTTGLTLHTILLDEREDGRIYIVASGNGPYRSDDSGNTWTVLKNGVNEGCPMVEAGGISSNGLECTSEVRAEHLDSVHSCTHKMILSGKQEGLIYQQNHCGIYNSSNHGDLWHDISPAKELRHGFPIDIIENGGRNIFAIPARENDCKKHLTCIQGQMEVIRSSDSGKNWKGFSKGLPSDAHTNVLRDSLDHDTLSRNGLYFGTTTGEVYLSTDLGETWRVIARGLGRIQGVSNLLT